MKGIIYMLGGLSLIALIYFVVITGSTWIVSAMNPAPEVLPPGTSSISEYVRDEGYTLQEAQTVHTLADADADLRYSTNDTVRAEGEATSKKLFVFGIIVILLLLIVVSPK